MPSLQLITDNNGMYKFQIMNTEIRATIGNVDNMQILCDAMVNDWETVVEFWGYYVHDYPTPGPFFDCTEMSYEGDVIVEEIEGRILRNILNEVGDTLIEVLAL